MRGSWGTVGRVGRSTVLTSGGDHSVLNPQNSKFITIMLEEARLLIAFLLENKTSNRYFYSLQTFKLHWFIKMVLKVS